MMMMAYITLALPFLPCRLFVFLSDLSISLSPCCLLSLNAFNPV